MASNKSSVFLFLLLAKLLQIPEVASKADVVRGSSYSSGIRNYRYKSNNITGSDLKLSPSGPNASMTSPSGDFAFGFRSPGSDSSLFLLAIWFNNTSSAQPIIWFATNSTSSDTGAVPVLAPTGSNLGFSQEGDLVLAGPSSEIIWSAGTNNATHVALLDQGNLILYDNTGSNLWQSFNTPTDTLVPGQSLNKGSVLQSKFNDANFSPGRFQLKAEDDGQLAFYIVVKPSDPTSLPYWSSYDNNKNYSGASLVFDQSGTLYYESDNGTSLLNISQHPVNRYYQHATIDPDGVFRVYVYDKNLLDNGSWSVEAELPEDACSVTVQVGSGMCGFNAYCTQSSNSNLPRLNCMCPERYSFFNASDLYHGCQPDFALQNCAADEATDFQIVELQDADWTSAGDYMHFDTADEDDCKQSCLDDCFCAVAIYRGTDCWKKKLPLSNGHQGTSVGGKALIKIRVSDTSVTQSSKVPSLDSVRKKDRASLVISGAVMLGVALMILIVAVASASHCLCKKRDPENKQVNLSQMGMNMKIFSCKDLHDATKGFAEELGRGSFGIVYKGVVKLGDHPVAVAVKKLDRLLKDGDQEFTNEVQSIGQIHHKNLVKLFGFCNEGPYRMLVYEYMSNGSLTNFLFGAAKLGWNTRAQIAVGVAQGLCYLHEGCSSQIIHCDIKPHNILLDDNLNPRISDFGLAKLIGVDQTRATTSNIRGTKGYFAPEWFKCTGITPKMDVYSFGVMLLEIVCCRRNIKHITEEEDIPLTYWAYDCYKDGRIDLLIQEDKEAGADIDRMEIFLRVAIWCIQENPAIRPTMHTVAQMLEGTVAVAPPPDPSSHI